MSFSQSILIRMALLALLVLTSCKNDEQIEANSDLKSNKAPNSLSATNEELAVIEECQAMAISDADVLAEKIIGKWQMVAYGCGFCVPHDDPSMKVQFANDFTGSFTRREDGVLTEQIEFEWSTSQDTILSAGGGSSTIARISTDPNIYAISPVNICSKYMVFNHAPFDGLTIIWYKTEG